MAIHVHWPSLASGTASLFAWNDIQCYMWDPNRARKTNQNLSLRFEQPALQFYLPEATKAPAKRGHIVAATLCPAMLPASGKMRQHCCAPRGHNKCFWRFSETLYVSRTQKLCRTQMLHAWQNESTFGVNDHVSNVATTMCPCFAGA